MAYDYIKKHYQIQPTVGRAVRHTVTNKFGKIARENPSQGHYVQVKFESSRHALPCHPDELELVEYAEDVEFMGHPIP